MKIYSIALILALILLAAQSASTEDTPPAPSSSQTDRIMDYGSLDKALHLLGGLSVSLCSLGIMYLIVPDSDLFATPAFSTTSGLGLGILAGSIKEIVDGFFPEEHSQEVGDILATAIGGWVGGIIFYEIFSIMDLLL